MIFRACWERSGAPRDMFFSDQEIPRWDDVDGSEMNPGDDSSEKKWPIEAQGQDYALAA
jgi:hypothetical protein